MSDSATPAALLKNLEIDKVKMADTTLAQDYFKKHNYEFRPIVLPNELVKPSENEFDRDIQNNKIYRDQRGQKREEIVLQPVKAKTLLAIASEIETNAELFAQIAYLTRNAKMADIKMFDVKIIAKQFRSFTSYESPGEEIPVLAPMDIEFSDGKPLYALGELAQTMHAGMPVMIKYTPNSAALCHLFVELCFKAGCTMDVLQCRYSTDIPSMDVWLCSVNYIEGQTLGSVAVVTDRTDMDSAVSALVDATDDPQYSWRLARVIVQESVYKQFKRALQNKTARETTNTPPADTDLESKSELLIVHGHKTFLVDYAGSLTDEQNLSRQSYVRVEAYRTTKELLALLSVYQPLYLSVWCSDLSTSHEIAFGAKPCTVWLNDFGVVEIGQPLLKLGEARQKAFISREKTPEREQEIPELNKLKKLRADWIKTDVHHRKDVVSGMLNKYICGKYNDLMQEAEELLKAMSYWGERKSFSHVENGRLRIGIYEPRGVVGFPNEFGVKDLLDIFESVVLGNGLLVNHNGGRLYSLLSMCSEAGVPIQLLKRQSLYECEDGIDLFVDRNLHRNVSMNDILYNKRVILSHFGETFAN